MKLPKTTLIAGILLCLCSNTFPTEGRINNAKLDSLLQTINAHEKQIYEEIEANTLFDPRGQFESKSDFRARSKKAERYLLRFKRNLFRNSFQEYTSIYSSEFEPNYLQKLNTHLLNYDPDKEKYLIAVVDERLGIDSLILKISIERKEAKIITEGWDDVNVIGTAITDRYKQNSLSELKINKPSVGDIAFHRISDPISSIPISTDLPSYYSISQVAFNEVEDKLYFYSQPGRVSIYDLDTKTTQKIDLKIADISKFAFSPSKKYYAIGTMDSVLVVELKSGTVLFSHPQGEYQKTVALKFDPTEKYVCIGTWKGATRLYTLDGGEKVLDIVKSKSASITDIDFSLSGELMAVSWQRYNHYGGVDIYELPSDRMFKSK